MGSRQGPSRRTRLMGMLIVGLVLALAIPAVAHAANVASFSYRAPASGSSLTNAQPTISVIVYDRYGVRGTYPTNYSMTIDGKAVKPARTYYAGTSYRKFKLSYRPSTPLSSALHTVAVRVKDARGYASTTSWKFRVDKVAPVTTVNGPLPQYRGTAFLWLSATDSGVGVSKTYYSIDGGATQIGNGVTLNLLTLGAHNVKYWSVDKLGNTEAQRTLNLNIISRHDTAPGFATTCGATGCHVAELAQIHAGLANPATPAAEECDACHGVGKTASNQCTSCHTISTPVHTPHVTIESSSTAGETCTDSKCHGTNLMAPHTSCAVCHASSNAAYLAVIEAGNAKCESCHGTYTGIHGGADVLHAWTNFTCAKAGCHPGDAAKVHTTWASPPGCPACHAAGKTPTTNCDACHSNYSAVHGYAHQNVNNGQFCMGTGCHAGTTYLDLSVPTTTTPIGHTPNACYCHSYASAHLNEVIEKGIAGTTVKCADCHSGEHAPHAEAHAAIDKTDSAICTSCHGSNYYTVASIDASGNVNVPLDPADEVTEHKACSCHDYGETEAPNECVDCHEPHGFSETVKPWDPTGSWVPAGGHNTPLYDVNGATEHFGTDVIIKDSQENTITQHWPLPTANVFWSQANAVKKLAGETVTATVVATDYPEVAMSNRGFASAAEATAAINTEVGWGSVITCYDCHTELEGLEGPQGANAANYGLDPNFPDDWTKAELTSWDPTGMRSIATTSGGTNPYYTTIGAQIYTPDDSSVPATGNLVYNNPSTVATLWAGQIYNVGAPASQGYSMGNTSPKRFICSKCHKLVNSFQGQAIEGNGRGNRSNALNYMGFSNYPHMEHHGDMITGQGNCVSCHVAIPHGWKRPRLLVYESDPAPYKVQWVYSGYRTAGTAPGAAKDPNPDLSNGNWGYLGVGSSNTLYQDLNALNSYDATGAAQGEKYSSHLERIAASPNAHKILEAIPLEHFLDEMHANELEGNPATRWDEWDEITFGVNWHADETNERGHYNNCSACTSAGNRHDDTQAGVDVYGEDGPAAPYWK